MYHFSMGEVYELNSKTLKAGQVSSTSFLSASLGAPLHGLSPTLSRVSLTAGAATGLFTLVCSVSSRQPEPAQYMFELNLISLLVGWRTFVQKIPITPLSMTTKLSVLMSDNATLLETRKYDHPSYRPVRNAQSPSEMVSPNFKGLRTPICLRTVSLVFLDQS